jgi:hypothetical protein
MAYCVRLLTPSVRVIPYEEILEQVDSLKLTAGDNERWDQIEVYDTNDKITAVLERHPVSGDNPGGAELTELRDFIQRSYPVSAREWLNRYFLKIRTIYVFRLFSDNITSTGWPVLGRVQNFLKDSLTGIIQADNEGYYNENGDYILWQMYQGAAGSIPAATLNDDGSWITYQLKLDEKSIERFKQGLPPPAGFFDRLFRR